MKDCCSNGFRTDGTRIERVAGGAFDNPVELVFTPEGAIIGTMDQAPGDRLLHYVEGGVYPHDNHPSINEFARTGPLLGSVAEFSAALPVALCGIERLRSPYFGPNYQGRLLTAQFNVHRVQQHDLVPDGATFRATQDDFLVTFDHNVHPSDVFEDADGSLLVIDMGAWFNYGCPTSKIAKPEVKGSIYRVRRIDATAPNDPWGKLVNWDERTVHELAKLLDDRRPKVRDKAVARLAKRGAEAVPALRAVGEAVDSCSLQARRNALWALARIDHPTARAAVREANMQPDPLTIVVERGDVPLAATPLSLPRLKVSIKNVDIERKEVGFIFGGDYRSGRQARWRLAVVDDKGKTVPTKQPDGLIIIGGGQYSEGRLKYGESWETLIDMREFIEAPLPGRYQLHVLYHNTRTILYSEDISGLIVCRSDKISFVVSPTVIQLTEKQKATAHEWIAALEPTKRVKVVAGTYGKWAHDFIRPESPQGKVLGMGLKAAPPLIEALQGEAISAGREAIAGVVIQDPG